MFCYTGRSDVPVPEYAPVTKTGYVLFGSFNTFRKINDGVLKLWKAILRQVENSRLLIKSQIFIDRECVCHVYQRLAYLGFDTSRVIIEQATTNYMNRYLDVDIHLDSFPYPGGGTTADALYMGVPVIALKGTEHSSRFADSFLTAAGVPELLADSPADYIAKAASLAQDIPRLDKYHRTLRNTLLNSKLMDTPAMCRPWKRPTGGSMMSGTIKTAADLAFQVSNHPISNASPPEQETVSTKSLPCKR